ncbi:MAG: AMP-binding protein [Brevibacterium sp.]|uniref:AMP-binding protein n=1 Tax=Brevibacterium sp. TaxID=1701 RepID=UPI00264A13A8|nr:AMP-binding protein [Brevibacterium sp.]MDN5805970.1 AMP-binding protein [Brevibacterium sp.]MDN5833302.1 AMP-binding protein [Brevibacterium sp.]MDN5876222.1 AMP-binding protein [Brevibacterium sp.]MDN5908150.1 AMP-binding protein [Brevibacterium sp.]MDN6134995.1 AMP-binding protein [Brevibacterium sp.]
MNAQPVEDLPGTIDRALGGQSILILPRTRDAPITEVAPSMFAGSGRAPALVLFTSGSTGTAKAVALSAEALATSARATERLLAGPGEWHLSLPINHIAGFQVELRARLAGREPVRTTSATFTADAFADEAGELFARSGGRPSYTSLVPTQMHRILADERATQAAAKFDAILLGGSAISPALLEQAAARGLSIVRTYGMSETAGGCVYNGVPFDGVEITITNSSTIDLRGRVVADSYVEITPEGHIAPVDDQALTTDDDGARSMHTSDLGRLDDGVLTVLGRADDIIVSGGTNVSPHALETGLLPIWQHHGIAEVLVTWVPDDEWGKLLVALVRLDDSVSSAVSETMNSPRDFARCLGGLDHGMHGQLLPRLAFPVRQIPNRSIGKPDRQAAARLAAEMAETDNS